MVCVWLRSRATFRPDISPKSPYWGEGPVTPSMTSNSTSSTADLTSAPDRRSAVDEVLFDVMLGVTGPSPQYGLLGEMSGRKVALDLNQTHTISLFGVQGGGKSYTLGTIVEMASLSIPHLNRLPQPLATVIFHYSPTMDYRPEFTSMVHANTDENAVALLQGTYGTTPAALKD